MDTTIVVDTVAAVVNAVQEVGGFFGLSLGGQAMLIMTVFSVISILVRLTPTKKDDKVYGIIMKAILFIFEKSNRK